MHLAGHQRLKMKKATVEILFINFLFYANLLMGEFNNNGLGKTKGFFWAVKNIFSIPNIIIGIVSSFIAYFIFEYLRRLFSVGK